MRAPACSVVARLRRDEDVLDLGERVERVGTELAAEAGLLEAAERRRVAHRRVRVDRQVAGLDAAGDPQRAPDVAGPDRAGQAVLGVVGHPDRVGLVVERHHRHHRAEDLLAPDRGRSAIGGQHRRREPVARARRARAAEGDRRASSGTYDGDGLALPGRDQRAHLGGRPARVLDPHAPDRGLEQLQEPVVARRAAPGSATARSSPGRRCRTRRTAPWPPPRSRSASANTMFALLPPSSSVTRLTWSAQPAMIRLPTAVDPVKHDLAHRRVGDEPLADDRALAGDHREDALGQAGLEAELAEPDRGQRGELGGLEHDRVAGRQRRREPPAGDRHREVPRHDHADDAERLLERDVDAAGHRDLPAEQPLRARPSSSPARRGRCPPPSARCRSCGRRCATSSSASSSMCASTSVGEPAQQPARGRPGATARQRLERRGGARDRGVGPRRSVGQLDARRRPRSVAGLITS